MSQQIDLSTSKPIDINHYQDLSLEEFKANLGICLFLMLGHKPIKTDRFHVARRRTDRHVTKLRRLMYGIVEYEIKLIKCNTAMRVNFSCDCTTFVEVFKFSFHKDSFGVNWVPLLELDPVLVETIVTELYAMWNYVQEITMPTQKDIEGPVDEFIKSSEFAAIMELFYTDRHSHDNVAEGQSDKKESAASSPGDKSGGENKHSQKEDNRSGLVKKYEDLLIALYSAIADADTDVCDAILLKLTEDKFKNQYYKLVERGVVHSANFATTAINMLMGARTDDGAGWNAAVTNKFSHDTKSMDIFSRNFANLCLVYFNHLHCKSYVKGLSRYHPKLPIGRTYPTLYNYKCGVDGNTNTTAGSLGGTPMRPQTNLRADITANIEDQAGVSFTKFKNNLGTYLYLMYKNGSVADDRFTSYKPNQMIPGVDYVIVLHGYKRKLDICFNYTNDALISLSHYYDQNAQLVDKSFWFEEFSADVQEEVLHELYELWNHIYNKLNAAKGAENKLNDKHIEYIVKKLIDVSQIGELLKVMNNSDTMHIEVTIEPSDKLDVKGSSNRFACIIDSDGIRVVKATPDEKHEERKSNNEHGDDIVKKLISDELLKIKDDLNKLLREYEELLLTYYQAFVDGDSTVFNSTSSELRDKFNKEFYKLVAANMCHTSGFPELALSVLNQAKAENGLDWSDTIKRAYDHTPGSIAAFANCLNSLYVPYFMFLCGLSKDKNLPVVDTSSQFRL